MRDFEQDVLRAAYAGEPLKASEFSWSCSRYRLFRFCRRAYFIRYYLAQGGWDIHAHPLCRSAYLEKHLPSLDQWIANTFDQALRAALTDLPVQASPEKRKDLLQSSLLKKLQAYAGALYRSLESRAYLEDPKLPGFREHYYGDAGFQDPDRVCTQIIKRFAEAWAVFLSSDFMRSAGVLGYPDYRLNHRFLCLPWRGYSVWLHGGIIRFEGDNAIMLNIVPETESVEKRFFMGLEMGIFERIVKYQWVNRVPSLEKFFIGKDSAAFLFTPESLPVADVIDTSAEAMLMLVDADGMVRMEDFPECDDDDAEKCAVCRFRKTCAALKNADAV